MIESRVHHIKRAQKEKLLLREISTLFMQVIMDDTELQPLSISRIQLSPDKSNCSIFFHTDKGEDEFRALFPQLVLYKPSLRAAISKKIYARKTPNFTFKYDKKFGRQQRLETLLSNLDCGEEQ